MIPSEYAHSTGGISVEPCRDEVAERTLHIHRVLTNAPGLRSIEYRLLHVGESSLCYYESSLDLTLGVFARELP